jgi:curli biogenesis system outer membrane secretion channel CsgG
MRGRTFAVVAAVLILAAGCGDEPSGSTAQPAGTSAPAAPAAASPSPSVRAQDCRDVRGVLDQYYPLFAAVQGKVLESVKRNDQKTAVEGMQKADQLVKEWAGRVEPQVATVTQSDLHDALVTLLDQMRQYTTSNGMNAGNVAKAAENVKTALDKICA